MTQVQTGDIFAQNGEIYPIAQPVIQLYDDGKEILEFVANAMDAMETLGKLKGPEKKAYVMDKAKELVLAGPLKWEKWFNIISRFIDTIKTIFNLAKSLVK